MDTCQNATSALLTQLRPKTLLCIGSGCGAWQKMTDVRVTVISGPEPLTEIGKLGRFDFALLLDTLERLPKRTGEQLLARLRDLHGGHFAVQLPAESHSAWSDNELRAFGLVLLARCNDPSSPDRLWGFDIRTYKPTPEWLNPKFWAHPELWDRYWW
ncbi:DUF6231 family protein [Thiohalomonas denitrificans]|uniref:Uncharacterized protein n=1 Tax=Thiohalomonas denitrificans TaxID=415747 RepID=A0A1G5PZQ7_9GAMM|nr:DUF6231 family protein [Thiohalomonas denitrificans]SCZ54631.1 hypothetical protein SAMN03097708_01002 [Thiohalomonas denitrificans]